MKQLPIQFDKSGWHFVQLKRISNVAIYSRTNIKHSDVVYFETIAIKQQEAMTATVGGNEITFHSQELYPPSEQFGALGKCCMTLVKAEAYFAKFTHEYEPQDTIYSG